MSWGSPWCRSRKTFLSGLWSTAIASFLHGDYWFSVATLISPSLGPNHSQNQLKRGKVHLCSQFNAVCPCLLIRERLSGIWWQQGVAKASTTLQDKWEEGGEGLRTRSIWLICSFSPSMHHFLRFPELPKVVPPDRNQIFQLENCVFKPNIPVGKLCFQTITVSNPSPLIHTLKEKLVSLLKTEKQHKEWLCKQRWLSSHSGHLENSQ